MMDVGNGSVTCRSSPDCEAQIQPWATRCSVSTSSRLAADAQVRRFNVSCCRHRTVPIHWSTVRCTSDRTFHDGAVEVSRLAETKLCLCQCAADRELELPTHCCRSRAGKQSFLSDSKVNASRHRSQVGWTKRSQTRAVRGPRGLMSRTLKRRRGREPSWPSHCRIDRMLARRLF